MQIMINPTLWEDAIVVVKTVAKMPTVNINITYHRLNIVNNIKPIKHKIQKTITMLIKPVRNQATSGGCRFH